MSHRWQRKKVTRNAHWSIERSIDRWWWWLYRWFHQHSICQRTKCCLSMNLFYVLNECHIFSHWIRPSEIFTTINRFHKNEEKCKSAVAATVASTSTTDKFYIFQRFFLLFLFLFFLLARVNQFNSTTTQNAELLMLNLKRIDLK